jgi:hypothetical protein
MIPDKLSKVQVLQQCHFISQEYNFFPFGLLIRCQWKSWYFNVFKGMDTNQGIICHLWGNCSLTIIDMVVLAFDGLVDNVAIEMSNPSME